MTFTSTLGKRYYFRRYHQKFQWYEGADGFLLMFDVTVKHSLDEIKSIHSELTKVRGPNVPCLLLGTKGKDDITSWI
jgi:GTPase SAR1 family protein